MNEYENMGPLSLLIVGSRERNSSLSCEWFNGGSDDSVYGRLLGDVDKMGVEIQVFWTPEFFPLKIQKCTSYLHGMIDGLEAPPWSHVI